MSRFAARSRSIGLACLAAAALTCLSLAVLGQRAVSANRRG